MGSFPPATIGARSRAPQLSFGPFTFDPGSRLLRRNGEEVALPPRVLGVLAELLERAGEVVPRQELINTVWKDAFVTDTSLAEAVSALRQALGDDAQSPTYVQTLHRRGYRFVAPVSSPEVVAASRAAAATTGGEEPVRPAIGSQLVPWSVAIISTVVAISAVWQFTRSNDPAAPGPIRFAVPPAAGTTFDRRGQALAISADGRQLAWAGCGADGCRLYFRSMSSVVSRAVAGTDGARAPFFSPDGESVGFFAEGRLKRVGLSGGQPVTLADAAEPLGGAWVGNEIIFAASPFGGLLRMPAQGGTPAPLTVPQPDRGELRHAWPSPVPGRPLLVFSIGTGLDGPDGDVGLVSLEPGARESSRQTVLTSAAIARAASSDLIVFSRGTELQAMVLDPVRLATSGPPRTILVGAALPGVLPQFALSATGTLAYVEPSPVESAALTYLRSSSGVRDASHDLDRFTQTALSPDGTRIAGVSSGDSRSDIWIADLERGATSRLTYEHTNAAPVWSADGRALYFASRTDGPFEIWTRDVEGRLPSRRLLRAEHHAIPASASADGGRLAFVQPSASTRADIWMLPLAGGSPTPIVQGPFDETAPAFSPDSTLLAYQSSEGGRWEVFVQTLADGRRVVASTDGGERPRWSADGRWLYYESGSRAMRVAVAVYARGVTIGEPSEVGSSGDALAGVLPGGALLFRRALPAGSTAVVATDWAREVRQLLGPPVTVPR